MKKIAVVYHSGFGHTEVQARHVHEGAQSVDGILACLIRAEDAAQEPEKLNDMDAIIFGSPTYLGAVSAPFKAFMDATTGIWSQQQWKDKIAAGFTNSHSLAGDKLSTLIQMAVFGAQHGMIWVGQAEMNTSPEGQPGHKEAVNRVGTMLGASAQSDNADLSVTPSGGDLKSAELFGARVAQITMRMR
ncbi:NADPH-dependent FMN reductase [Leisingera sp. ANG1]|nr:NADPH-dependent FMN reductase [Leisingera sp. ANG-S3]KIC52482.1 NADPH-dependent FMN reductase [Leisingera sp. ANG-S]KID07502.1 NADPH-dependent FMN reductase [Leisingera sp. ANG1]